MFKFTFTKKMNWKMQSKMLKIEEYTVGVILSETVKMTVSYSVHNLVLATNFK